MTKPVPGNGCFADWVASHRPVLIDGGLATQCEALGANIDGALWSSALIRNDPDVLVRAHRAYLDAGARIIISASYQASREGFAAAGVDFLEADALIAHSVRLAQHARDAWQRDNPGRPEPLVAASVGPFGAMLHDGSEYTGNYPVTAIALKQFHAQRLVLLDESGADVLACETIPSAAEAQVLCFLLRAVSTPAWVSFSCRDGAHLADGTPLADVASEFRGHPTVQALGVNCVAPGLVVPLINVLRRAAPDKLIVVYPNSGERYVASDNTWHSDGAREEAAEAAEWVKAGASIVGGCCRVGPVGITAMARSLAR
ncbi:MAG: homocysteine S-methyltransferase [Pseudomonadota bacterium]